MSGFGKIYSRLYEGSMYGHSALHFAVMGYVIAKQVPETRHRDSRMVVELNPALLAGVFAEEPKNVESVIEFLCSPDKQSQSPEQEGRRLVRLGQFSYWVVNGRKYRELQIAEERREYFRVQKAQSRQAKAKAGKPLSGEVAHQKLKESGANAKELERHQESFLPRHGPLEPATAVEPPE